MLVQLAIIHAQFEIIHPFIDGNGRIGRILVPLFLAEKKVLSSPMFYVSGYLEHTREEYYDRLLAVTKSGDWLGWIKYFLYAVTKQAQKNSEQAKRILELYKDMKEEIAKSTRSQFSINTLDFLFSRPIFRTNYFARESKIPKASAARILNCLLEGRIIETIRAGKGRIPTIYSFRKLLDIVRN